MNYAQDCRSVFHEEACRIWNRAWTVGGLRDYQEAWRISMSKVKSVSGRRLRFQFLNHLSESRKNTVKEEVTTTATDWVSLRPQVTEALLTDITQRLVEKSQPHQSTLFGSYAYGEANADSDVDLLIVMDSNEPVVQRIIRVAEVAQVRFLPMDVLVYTRDEIEDRLTKGDFFIAEIFAKGRVLYNYDAR